MRLAAKLSLLLAAAGVLPVVLATALTLPKNNQALRAQLDALYQQSASALATEVNQGLSDKVEALALASHALPFDTLTTDEREQALLLVFRQTKGANIVGLFDTRGDPLAAPIYFSQFGPSDQDGHEPSEDAHLEPYAQHVPLKAALEAGIAVSPVYVGGVDPVPKVVVALAIDGSKERSVLAVELSLRAVVERFAEFALGHHGRAYLVDGEERIVAAKNPAFVITRTAFAEVRAAHALGAHASLSLVGWKTYVEQPEAEALAPIRRQVTLAAAAAAAALLIALIVGLSTVRVVTSPVARLREATAAVERGDLRAQVIVRGKDELAELGRSFNTMTRGLRERERLRATFSRYVSDEIAARVLEESADADLKGELVEVTVLFLDLRGFTSLSERCTPREVVDILNAYFDIVVREVAKHHGVINKFIGDAVMAIFGVPKAIPDPEKRSVRAAVAIRDAITALNLTRARNGQETAQFGIGINTGQAIAGNVGGQERLEYTVIGDAVNVAQRLQSIAAGGEVIISASTVARIGDAFSLIARSQTHVKGRAQAVASYLLR